MKKATKALLIVSIFLIISGAIVSTIAFAELGFNIKELDTEERISKTYTIEDKFNGIKIDGLSEDIELRANNDKTCRVEYCINKSIDCEVSVKNDKLTINCKDKRKWYEKFLFSSFSLLNNTITVYLPEKEYDSLVLSTTSGDIDISEDLYFSDIDVEVTSGDISCNCGAKNNVSLETTSGDIELNNVIANEISAKTTSGDIKINSSDAKNISLKATSGDITGTVLSDKDFDAKATSGDVSVPNSSSDEECYVRTTSGDIKISVE